MSNKFLDKINFPSDLKELSLDNLEDLAAELRTNNFTTPVYLMKAANAAYSLGQKDKALSLYTRIENEFATSREGQNIGKYIARITSAQ